MIYKRQREPIPVRVRLNVDMTRYHLSLKAGAIGTTFPPQGAWARRTNRFVKVFFPGIVLDVKWKNLTEIGETDG